MGTLKWGCGNKFDSNLFGDTSSTDFTAWNMAFMLEIYKYYSNC